MKKKKKLQTNKHVPIRTCIGTGVKKPKNELIRLVRLPDGVVKIDLKGKERGRGASIDTNERAFDLAVKRGAIEKSLKLEKKLSQDKLERLKLDFIDAIEEKSFRQGNKPVTIRVKKEDLEKS